MQNKSSFSLLLILDAVCLVRHTDKQTPVAKQPLVSRVIGKTEATGVMHNLQNMLHAKFSNWQIVIYVYLHDSEIFISQILKVFFARFISQVMRVLWPRRERELGLMLPRPAVLCSLQIQILLPAPR